MNRATFLDRDGTIARDVPYCSRPEDFELLPTVGEGIRRLNESGFKVIIITNQSGIARGYFTEEMLERIHKKMKGDLAEYGAHIDAIYCCPHHPDDHCQCRKPDIGLFKRAAQEGQIDLNSSYLIGDKFLDVGAANKAGCKMILVPSSEPEIKLLENELSPQAGIDFICRDFYTAARWVISDTKQLVAVSVIISTLNEEKNLSYVLPRIPKIPDITEVVLVDGHSTDSTVEVAKRLRPDIRVLYQPGRGKGDALKYGFKHARGGIIVTLDADGSTDPEEMPNFINALLDGYDFAKGTRLSCGRPRNMPWHRWLGNKILVLITNIVHGTKYTDVCSGYNAFWKKALEGLELLSDGFEVEPEMNVRIKKAGLRVIEIPSIDKGRLGSNSKLSAARQGWKDLITILRERFRE